VTRSRQDPASALTIRFADSRDVKGFERSSTPTSDDEPTRNDPPAFISQPRDLSDEDEEYVQQRRPQKKGGYDSRIEQILYENEDLQILITDAGKSHENGGSYIAYTIRTGVCQRRECEDDYLTLCRSGKFGGGIQNSAPYELPSSTFIQR
jgi:hypothetical protein